MIRSLIARGAAALALLSFVAAPVRADITVKDGAGASVTIGAQTFAGKQIYGFAPINTSGAYVSPATTATDVNTAAIAATVAAAGSPSATAQTVQPGAGAKFDGVLVGTAFNRSAVIGFAGIASAAVSAANSVTVAVTSTFTNTGTSAVTGVPIVGQTLTGLGVSITAVTNNGSGSYTLTLSGNVTVASGATVSSGGPQLVMAANTARRFTRFENQGTGVCYETGLASGTLDANSYMIAPGQTVESSPAFITTSAISVACVTAATPLFVREGQ